MEINLSPEQKLKMLETVFMDDYDYDTKYISQLSDEEYERFLELCPEFEENSQWARLERRKDRNLNFAESMY